MCVNSTFFIFFIYLLSMLVRFGQRHGRLCNKAKVWTLSTLLRRLPNIDGQPPLTILVAKISSSCRLRSQKEGQFPHLKSMLSTHLVLSPHSCHRNKRSRCNTHCHNCSLHKSCCGSHNHLVSWPHICCKVFFA